MNLSTSPSSQHGFSLIELMTVVGVIGVLSAIAIPQFKEYQSGGFQARIEADLRHVAIAEEAYFADFEVYRSCTNINCVNQLPGIISLSQGITLEMTATTTGFTGTATHPNAGVVCMWDSSQEGFIGCS